MKGIRIRISGVEALPAEMIVHEPTFQLKEETRQNTSLRQIYENSTVFDKSL